MMGLQVTANKRKYEIGACTDINDIQPNCTPAKTSRLDSHVIIQNNITISSSSCSSLEQLISSNTNGNSKISNNCNATISIGKINSSNINENGVPNVNNNNNNNNNSSSRSQQQEESNLANKLHAVSIPSNHHHSESWKEEEEPVIDPISKLQAVAVPDEAWGSDSTRSTLATTLLSPDDLDEDMDDFEDDFDDDDAILSNYSPIRYPVPSSKGYIPAYPRPGYFPEQYHNQNCSRTPGMYNRYTSWNNQYYHNEPMPVSDPPQTIRCAENGKSYTELGTYTFFNSNTTRHIKRCCDGKNNWCNNKQCYKEKRLRMMNLSMFKLSRFRQASDQSLYRSVLICNTLKSIEKEIEAERREIKRQQQQAAASVVAAASINQSAADYTSGPHSVTTSNNSNSSISNRVSRVEHPDLPNHNNEQQQQQQQLQPKTNDFNENNPSNSSNSSNLMNSSSTYLQSYTNHNRMQTTPSSNTFDSIPPLYEYHPLKDPQSGRATPFPSTGGYPDSDSGYGEEADLAPDGQFRSINWGSVLSLSSQSALDPLNNNELFGSPTSTYIGSSSNTTSNATSLSSTTITNNCQQQQQQTPSCTTTTTLTPLVTFTSSAQTNFSLSSIHASATDTTSTNNWDFNYLDMDLGYDVLPNCYKLSSFGSDDFLRTPLMEPSKVVNDNDMVDTFSTHIMVGS